MITPDLTIQKAYIRALEGLQLTTDQRLIDVPVYDYVPSEASRPYVKIVQLTSRESALTPKCNDCGIVYEVTVRVDVVTDYNGKKQSHEIGELIAEAILEKGISLPNEAEQFFSLDDTQYDGGFTTTSDNKDDLLFIKVLNFIHTITKK